MKNIIKFLILLTSILIITFSPLWAENTHFSKGILYYQKGNFELARAYFEEAKNTEPDNSIIYFYLGNTYYQLKDIDNAILNYTKGLNFSEGKQKGIFFYNLGNCYFLKKNYDMAIDMYKKAIEYNPELFDAYLNSGNAFYIEKKYNKTIESWETYLEKYPQTPQYEKIKKAIAYLKNEMSKQQVLNENKEETNNNSNKQKAETDTNLLNEVIGDLNQIIKNTENIMETSEKPINDLSSEDIER